MDERTSGSTLGKFLAGRFFAHKVAWGAKLIKSGVGKKKSSPKNRELINHIGSRPVSIKN
jgi:hypothetical protein